MEAGLARGPEIRLARVATPTYRVYEADHSFRWVQQPGQGTPGRPPTHLDRPPTHARLLDCLARLRRGSRKLCVNDSPPRRQGRATLNLSRYPFVGPARRRTAGDGPIWPA